MSRKSILKRSNLNRNSNKKSVLFNETVTVGYTHHPDDYDRSVIATSELTIKDIEEILQMREEMHRETQKLIKKQQEIEAQIFLRREEESKRIQNYKYLQMQRRIEMEMRYQFEMQQSYQNVLNQQWALYNQNYYPQNINMYPSNQFTSSPYSQQQNYRQVSQSSNLFNTNSNLIQQNNYYSIPVNPYQKSFYNDRINNHHYNSMLVPPSVV